MSKRPWVTKNKPDQLGLLHKTLLEDGIIIQPVQIDTDKGSLVRFDIIDMWWDLSLLFKSERLFPDQTKRMLTYTDALMYAMQILDLVHKFYPREKEDAETTISKANGTHKANDHRRDDC